MKKDKRFLILGMFFQIIALILFSVCIPLVDKHIGFQQEFIRNADVSRILANQASFTALLDFRIMKSFNKLGYYNISDPDFLSGLEELQNLLRTQLKQLQTIASVGPEPSLYNYWDTLDYNQLQSEVNSYSSGPVVMKLREVADKERSLMLKKSIYLSLAIFFSILGTTFQLLSSF